MVAMVVELELLTHRDRGLGTVWAHAGVAGTVLAHNRKGPLISPLLALCVAFLCPPATGTPDMSLLMPWPSMGAPNSCFFTPFLETPPPIPGP